MEVIYDYDIVDSMQCIEKYNDIQNISLKKLYFQLDYMGFIRGDILCKILSQNELINSIKKTIEFYESDKNNYFDEINNYSINQENYKKILMMKLSNFNINEYVIVNINKNDYYGTRLYLGYCFCFDSSNSCSDSCFDSCFNFSFL